MIKPKRDYVRKASQEVAVKFCENPQCGAKLSKEKAREVYKHCDKVCLNEHRRIQAIERRPKQVLCSFCNKDLDTMRANPAYWQKTELHFCDEICVDGYRRQSGFYEEISAKGNAAMQEYKEKHGQVNGYEDRAEATSKGNRERPPKAKHFVREGKIWGYDVKFYPHEDGQGYRVSVPELEEIGVLYAGTVKGGLKLVREKILELRAEEAQGENNAKQ